MSNQQWSTTTFGNEEGLPRVPLPTLEESCERFLAWCAPLLTADEMAVTRVTVEAFLSPGSPARVLHKALEHYDADPAAGSWLDRFWATRYLGRRDRIALNANFFFLLGDSPGNAGSANDDGGAGEGVEAGDAQVRRAAGLVTAALDLLLRLEREEVPPAVLRGRPQSMEQFRYLFSTTRIPGEVQDTFRSPYAGHWPPPDRARHVVVFFRGNAFRMDVLGPEDRPHSIDDLVTGLEAVRAAGATPAPPGTSVGRLTTGARAEWAAGRQRLVALGPSNEAALDVIETALFCVVLEDLVPSDDKEAGDVLLHGDSSNRWFDKAVSLVVFRDGTAGLNVEHCCLDGTTILAFVDTLLAEAPEACAARSGAATQGTPAVAPIEFVLDAAMREEVQAAGEAFADYAAATATAALSFDDFGAQRAKQLGISPDAFVQMCYQLAHKRAKGLIGATYESIATRQYRNGRTEAMRVVTPEVLAFVATMEDPAAAPSDRAAALREAASAHVTRAKECQRGDAPEQHLWELEMIQRRQGDELGATEPLALYRSPGWLVMRDDYLSTSAVPSPNVRYFGFGSTSDRCIGIAYALLPDRFTVYLSTPRAVADQMATFADRLTETVPELAALLAADAP